MKWTALTFGIAVFAIAGTPYFAGYYSKDMILQHAAAFGHLSQNGGRSGAYWLFFALPSFIAYVTAFYMTRCWMLTFWGKPRNQHLYDHAHESPILYAPLIVLAIASVIGGRFLYVKELIVNAQKEMNHVVATPNSNIDLFATAWHVEAPENLPSPRPEAEAPTESAHANTESALLEEGEHTMHHWIGWAWLIGIGLGIVVYWNGYWIADPLMKIPPLNWIRIWLYRRMYFDELYFSVFVAITMGLSRFSAAFDKYVVDGIVNLAGWSVKQLSFAVGLNDKYVVDGAVNGAADLAQGLGAAVRAPQSGRIRMYVTVLMIAVTLGLAGAIIVMLSH
jgi:NADH-quinone oxidoreductase subunit L